MPQGNEAVRMLAGRGVIGGVADAAVGGHRKDLLDARLFLIPQFDPVRQVLTAGNRPVKAVGLFDGPPASSPETKR